jgi:hypothetical protein
MASRRAARIVRRTSILTTVAWNDAQTSATSDGASGAWRRTKRLTAVLSPEKEKSGAPSRMSATGNGIARGSPSRAVRSITGPPG